MVLNLSCINLLWVLAQQLQCMVLKFHHYQYLSVSEITAGISTSTHAVTIPAAVVESTSASALPISTTLTDAMSIHSPVGSNLKLLLNNILQSQQSLGNPCYYHKRGSIVISQERNFTYKVPRITRNRVMIVNLKCVLTQFCLALAVLIEKLIQLMFCPSQYKLPSVSTS